MRKILVGLMLTCAGWATPALAKETIKVGAILGVTGPAANLGGPEARTLEMLVQEINKKGGIKGNPVELIVKDSSASPEKAISFAKQLIDEDRVFAIIGPSTSGETMKIKTLAEDGKTILCPVRRPRPSSSRSASTCSRPRRTTATRFARSTIR
jgi:branched-chain amino acid transport system substrate-binding protein